MEILRELHIQIREVHSLYLQLSYDLWKQYYLYTWKWWLLVTVMIIPWYFWWRFVDKKRILEIWCYGVMTFVSVIGSDAIGIANGCWYYPVKLYPKFPHILPVDTSLLPVSFMLLYQYFPKWKSFLIATTIMATCLAFICEPFISWLGFYELITWKYFYSFPLYILLSTALKLTIETIKAIQSRGDNNER